MNSNLRSIARIAALGGLAASAAVLLPGVASADFNSCADGMTIKAKAHNTTVHGTPCDDNIFIGQFSGVTVKAGEGDDRVQAGFGGGRAYMYLGDGNDTVANAAGRSVWVDAGAGNDIIEGHSGYDTFFGGSGTDTASGVDPGDDYSSIEIFN